MTASAGFYKFLGIILTPFVYILCVVFPYLIYKPPGWIFRWAEWRWGKDVLWRVKMSEKVVGLTIDDAPSNMTEEISTILSENEAHATFFIIGSRVTGHEEVLENLVRSGHELGNHTKFDRASKNLPVDELRGEIKEVEGQIEGIYSKTDQNLPKHFRPGSGFFNTKMRELTKRLGYQLVLGSIYPHDPQIKFPHRNAQHILHNLKPGRIIICHDGRDKDKHGKQGSDRLYTLKMLKEVLPKIRDRGYRIVNITELLKISGTQFSVREEQV